MVLIEQYDGVRRRRCDAQCYNGKRARCRCICGGRNHGKGLQQAQENVREMAKQWIEHAKATGVQLHLPQELLNAVTRGR